MKQLAPSALALSLAASPLAQAQQNTMAEQDRTMTTGKLPVVPPALERDAQETLFGDLWQRPDPSSRDRSIVTVAALIASSQVAQIPCHLNRAMDNGLTKAQAGEVITRLAFYADRPNAFSVLPVTKEVFTSRSR